MATKWKYATIPASQRLSMLKDGNDELYKEEIARTKDAISNRLAAGLDVSEQMKWADTVSYNHNLSKAKAAGVDESSVAKDGYADRLFGDMTESVGKDKVSTVSAPKAIYDKKYYEDYETMNRDDLAKSVADSYIGGINRRANLLSAEHKEYIKDIDKEYDKKIRDAKKAYEENEKLYEEQRINSGYSEKGARALTEKAKAREELYDYVNQMRKEKNELKQKANDSLKETLYDMSENAMKAISDEYYRYNSLLSDEENAEYEKLRNAAEDDKWWNEFLFQKTKEENDMLLAQKELAFKESSSAQEYEQWLKEFEAETEYNNAKLRADIASDNAKTALNREKFEYEKAQNGSAVETPSPNEQYGEYYKNCLATAQRMAAFVEYDNAAQRYVPRYSAAELRDWIKGLDLSENEKRRICSSIGIKYDS